MKCIKAFYGTQPVRKIFFDYSFFQTLMSNFHPGSYAGILQFQTVQKINFCLVGKWIYAAVVEPLHRSQHRICKMPSDFVIFQPLQSRFIYYVGQPLRVPSHEHLSFRSV